MIVQRAGATLALVAAFGAATHEGGARRHGATGRAAPCNAAGVPAARPLASGKLEPRSTGGGRAVTQPELTQRALRDGLREHARRADRAGRVGNWDEQARELTVVAMAYNRLGRPDSALVPAAAATSLLARSDNPATIAGVRATYGESLQHQGRHAEALAQYDTALQRLAAPRTGELLDERARLCANRGSALLSLGDVDEASTAYAAALTLRHALGDVAGEALVLHNLARLLQVVGRPDSSLTLFHASLELRERAPDAAAEAVTLNAVGYSYDLLGHPDSALVLYNRALARLGGANVTLEGLSLMNRGRSRLALGDVDGAARDFEASRALVRTVSDAVGDAWALEELGLVHVARREWALAEARLDSAREALHAAGDRAGEGEALFRLAEASLRRGDSAALRVAVSRYAAAAARRRDVAVTARRDEDRVPLAEQDALLTAHWVLAWVALADAGDPAAAARALAAAEEGRARALVDLVRASRATARRGRPPDSSSAGNAGMSDPIAVVRREGVPALVHLVAPDAVVAWLVRPDGSVVMACTRVPRATVQVLVGLVRAGALARDGYRDTTDRPRRPVRPIGAVAALPLTGCRSLEVAPAALTPAAAAAAAGALQEILLPPPVAAALPDTGELIIVPHGVLAQLPYALLGARPDNPSRALGLRLALRYAPSLALLDAVPPSAAVRFRAELSPALIVGNPSMPIVADGERLEPLPHAGAGAAWLAGTLGTSTLTGDAATEAVVRAAMPDARLVHLGTHGRAYTAEARARLSWVALAPGDGEDGLLTAGEILAGPPLRAELVTLSACQTALGDATDAEGTVGLQRAFLARGARSVLVSLWRVNDEATERMLRSFYARWPDSSASKPTALRSAQRQLARDATGRAVHPYFWAGFQLVGAR